ncbi:MAG: hypothetical protein L0Y80_01980 [Ignavibacteriae bacterium]|nr:hypothetical protein [Ignavibacteriota bacterium]
MKNRPVTILIAAFLLALIQSTAFAHGGGKNVKLHINPRWKECSVQLDPALTQDALREFAQEAGLVAYFRPLVAAKPMGSGNYEFSILQWATAFDDTKPAWNDTFVHPDSTHWLKEGDRLGFPGLTFRAGITERIDVGMYFTKNPGANYGFWGGQVQYNFAESSEDRWASSARMSFVSLHGPDDLDLTVYGIEVLASKDYTLYSDWVAISPYAGVSTYLSTAHETTTAVSLRDERVFGVQGMIGAVTQISIASLAIEYNVSTVNTLSFKIGVAF